MSFVDRVFNPVEEDLEEVEVELNSLVDSNLQPLTDSSLYLLKSGGKRLRPALVLLSGKLFDYDLSKLKPLAIAVELVHMASLVHDDIIDESNLRRGSVPINNKWNNKIAVLSGDLLYTYAANSLADLDNRNYLNHILKDALAMTRGQASEVVNDGRADITIDEYLTRIRQKTARLISKSCLLGAMAGGSHRTVQQNLEGYGLNLGLSFQIMDDLKDLFGTSEDIGKEPGKDLKEGVPTLPVILAMRRSKKGEELKDVLRDEDPSRDMIERGIEIIRNSGAVEESLRYSKEYGNRALNFISNMSKGPAAHSLGLLARYLSGERVEGNVYLNRENV